MDRHVLSGQSLESWIAQTETGIEMTGLGLTGTIFQATLANRPAIALQVGRIVTYYVDASNGTGDAWDIHCSWPLGLASGDVLTAQVAQTFEVGPGAPPSPRESSAPYRVGDWISFKTSTIQPGSANFTTVDGGRFRISKVQRTSGQAVGLAIQVNIEFSPDLSPGFTCAFYDSELTAVDDTGGVYYQIYYFGSQLRGAVLSDACGDSSAGKIQGWLWFYGFPAARQLSYLDFNPILGSNSHITAP